MKKILSITITLAMLLSLAACGSASQTSTSQNEAVESPASEQPASEQAAAVQNDTSVSGTLSSAEDGKYTLTTEDGQELSFTVNDSTQYSIEMGDMPIGNGEQGGTPPEIPAGDFQQSGTRPEMPTGDGQQSGTAPQMPSGDFQQSGSRPEMPSGDFQQSGTRPEMPSDDGQQDGSFPNMPSGGFSMNFGAEMLTVGTAITVNIGSDGTASEVVLKLSGGFMGSSMGNFGGFGGGEANISYTSVNTFSESASASGETYTSTGTDENAILVSGGEVTLENASIERTSADSTGGDNSSFYGVGAAVLTTDGTVSISGSTINTDAAGGAGVFAYGSGTAYVSDTTIVTQQNTSGGIHVAGGGTLYAWDLNVETNGESAAAIRSDRGSGTMVVDGGSYTSNGIGSPAIYCTADISVNNAALTATGSEAICIEGKNSIRLYDCELSGSMSDDSRNDCTWNVILYQSMSGDSAVGNSLFEMVGGTLTANNGGMFYTTNTESTFVLSGVDIVTPEDCEFLLKCTGNANQRGWGKTGANGAQCTFSAINQSLTGDVIWDSISTLDFYMTGGSTLTGAFVNDESSAGSGGEGYACLSIDKDCTWIVTKDSTLSSLKLLGSVVDENGKTVSIVGSDGTVYVQGESSLTVTVDNFYYSADMSGCGTVSSFSDYAVSKQ